MRKKKTSESVPVLTQEDMNNLPTVLTGRQIKNLRKKINLTQTEFANKICVTKLTVSRWETNTRICKGPAIKLINLINYFDLWDKV